MCLSNARMARAAARYALMRSAALGMSVSRAPRSGQIAEHDGPLPPLGVRASAASGRLQPPQNSRPAGRQAAGAHRTCGHGAQPPAPHGDGDRTKFRMRVRTKIQ